MNYNYKKNKLILLINFQIVCLYKIIYIIQFYFLHWIYMIKMKKYNKNKL